MKYDNPRIRDILDDCVSKIMEESDEEFFKYVNTETRWLMRLAEDLFRALTPVNCFSSLAPAVKYLEGKAGTSSAQYDNYRYCSLSLSNTNWSFAVGEKGEGMFSFILWTEEGKYVVEYDSVFPAGKILTIDYHYPYIEEKATALQQDTERRRLLY